MDYTVADDPLSQLPVDEIAPKNESMHDRITAWFVQQGFTKDTALVRKIVFLTICLIFCITLLPFFYTMFKFFHPERITTDRYEITPPPVKPAF